MQISMECILYSISVESGEISRSDYKQIKWKKICNEKKIAFA